MPVGPERVYEKHPSIRREVYIDLFNDRLANLGQQRYNVLNFYGEAGIGKSELLKQLKQELDETSDEVPWASTDLSDIAGRTVSTYLMELSDQLSSKYSLNFEFFNIAHAIYWKKVHPEIPLSSEIKKFAKKDGLFGKAIQILDDFPLFAIPHHICELIAQIPESVKSLWRENDFDPYQVPEMDAYNIEKLLPYLFAIDLKTNLADSSNSVVIFMDTYDSLWKNQSDTVKFRENDEWLRDRLIANVDNQKVLWVICGREQLKWEVIDEDWASYIKKEPLLVFNENECTYYLENCDISDKQIQRRIYEGSRGNPLYLYLSANTFHRIRQVKQRAPILDDFAKTPDGIFERFVKYHKEEIDTLEVLSVPNFWDKHLFEKLVTEFKTGFPLADNSYLNLHRFSFISQIQNNGCKLHDLMRDSIQERMSPEIKVKVHAFMAVYYDSQLEQINIKNIEEQQKTALNEGFYHVKCASTPKDLFEWFMPKARLFDEGALWQWLEPLYIDLHAYLENVFGPDHPGVATTLNNLAELYRHMGNYQKALPLYQHALNIRERLPTEYLSDVATTLNDIAGLYKQMGNYEKALPLYQRALNIFESVLEPNHSYVARTLNNIASLYKQMGNYQEALPLCQRALDIFEKVDGPDHSYVALTLNNLADLYQIKGDYEKALPLYQRALNIAENVHGPDHPYVATTLNNLAGLYHSMGYDEKALPLCQRDLEISERLLGADHPDVATTLNNLARLYESIGNYKKVLPLYQRALDINERAFGADHPAVATTLNNLAGFYQGMRDYEKALPLYERALDIREYLFGTNHTDVAKTLNNLAGLYRKMDEDEKALPLCQRALSIFEDALGLNHPYVAVTLNNIASIYEYASNYEQALPLYQRALDIVERVLGPQHPYVAATLNNLAGLYHSMGYDEKALPLCQRALDIRERVLGPEHPDVATTLNNLAALHQSMGNYEQALPFYQRALEISERVLGPQHPDVITYLNNLAGSYRHIGNYEQALHLCQRVLDIRERVLGPEHPDVATTLNNLAVLHESMGNYEKALPLYQRALDIFESVQHPEHLYVATIKSNIAGLYKKMKRS